MTIRGYMSAGGKLAFEGEIASEVDYVYQLSACRELLDRGLLSRVDILKYGTTEALAALYPSDAYADSVEFRTKRKMAETGLKRG